MLDEIKADESYEKIKHRAMDKEFCRNWMPRICFMQNTNEDDDEIIKFKL